MQQGFADLASGALPSGSLVFKTALPPPVSRPSRMLQSYRCIATVLPLYYRSFTAVLKPRLRSRKLEYRYRSLLHGHGNFRIVQRPCGRVWIDLDFDDAEHRGAECILEFVPDACVACLAKAWG